jgi:hypothetical protein
MSTNPFSDVTAKPLPHSASSGSAELWRGLRWTIYGVMRVCEWVVITGLTVIGLVISADCAFVYLTVAHSHFPMAVSLLVACMCFAATVLYYFIQAWVKPDPR